MIPPDNLFWKLLAGPGSRILAKSDCLGVSFLPLVYIDNFLGRLWLVGVSVIGWLLLERMGVSSEGVSDLEVVGEATADGVPNLNVAGESTADGVPDINDPGESKEDGVHDLNDAAAKGVWVSLPGDPST